MPIRLTTPFHPDRGHGRGKAGPYTHAKIVKFAADLAPPLDFRVHLEYGTLDGDGNWIPAMGVDPRELVIEDKPAVMTRDGQGVEIEAKPEASDLVAASTTKLARGALVWDEVKASIYAYLLARNIYAGTIE